MRGTDSQVDCDNTNRLRLGLLVHMLDLCKWTSSCRHALWLMVSICNCCFDRCTFKKQLLGVRTTVFTATWKFVSLCTVRFPVLVSFVSCLIFTIGRPIWMLWIWLVFLVRSTHLCDDFSFLLFLFLLFFFLFFSEGRLGDQLGASVVLLFCCR